MTVVFFSKSKLSKEQFEKRKRVCRSIRRVVDARTPNMISESVSQRSAERYNRCVPIVVFPMRENRIDADSIFFASTKDLSDYGASVVTSCQLEPMQVICGFWQDGPILIGGSVRRSRKFGGNLFELGIEFTDVIDSVNTLNALLPHLQKLDVGT